MIPAVAQTLANILAVGTSLTGLEQISLSAPDTLSELKTGLNLYFYDVRQSGKGHSSGLADSWTPYLRTPDSEASSTRIPSQSWGDQDMKAPDDCSCLSWFDVSFVITAHNQTSLGMQELLSEALATLMQHRSIPKELLAPTLKGYEPLSLVLKPPPDIAGFWSALKLPLRPAIFVIVTVPLNMDRLSSTQPIGVGGWGTENVTLLLNVYT